MPSGYTADLYDLKEVSFQDFVSKCAYAFMIEGRDYHSDTLPDKPYDYDGGYHEEKLAQATQDLENFMKLSYEEVAEQNSEEYNKQLSLWSEQVKKNALVISAYKNMIKQVEAWTPPTENHKRLKFFMLDQLQDSIRHDTFEATAPVRISTEEFRKNKIESLAWKINYHKESL